MKSIIYVIGLFIACFSCSSEERQTKATSSIVSFDDYIKSLSKVDLPITFCSDKSIPAIKRTELSLEDYKRFIPKINMGTPYGIYFQNKYTTGIIYTIATDLALPCLITYENRTGNIIDKLYLYDYGGYDLGYREVDYMKLNEDLTLNYIDSTVTADTDMGKIIPGTEKTTVLVRNYKINEEGKIKLFYEGNQADTIVNYEYNDTPNSLARINLKMYGSKKFYLGMTLFADEHEEGSKNEDLRFNGVWEETKNELMLTFKGNKPVIESIFDKKYSRDNEFRILNDSTVYINKGIKAINMFGVLCEKVI